MKRLGKWLLAAVVCAGLFIGSAVISVRVRDAMPTNTSTQVPLDRLSPDYVRPAPEDTPCLQPEYVTRCIGRSTARTGLMQLAGLQAERKRNRGAYAQDAATLGFQPGSGMALRMIGGRDGWTAEYHHTAGGVGCAVYEGEVEEPYETFGGGIPEAPGAVACDDPLAGGR
jgi:hypothetical protein